MPERTIAFILTGAGGTASAVAITDFLGQALLPAVQLPSGTYTVNAYFAGTIPFPPRAAPDHPRPCLRAVLRHQRDGDFLLAQWAAVIRNEINVAAGGPVTPATGYLRDAVNALDKAFDTANWVDGNHLTKIKGNLVYDQIEIAVAKLMAVAKLTTISTSLRDHVQPWIDSLVGEARDLAAIAIREATGPGVNQAKLADAKARFDLAKTNEASRPDLAVDLYGQSWNKAVDARP